MNAFQEQLTRDRENIVLNTAEFAHLHEIEGKIMPAVVSSYRLSEMRRKAQYAEELYTAELVVLVSPDDLGFRPAKDAVIQMDGDVYRVVECSGELIYRIILGRNE